MALVETLPPSFSKEKLREIAANDFQLSIATIRRLPGDIGQNAYIQTQDGSEFVLKIANLAEKRPILEAQNQVLQRLIRELPDYHFPTPIAGRNGEKVIPVHDQNGTVYWARVLKYLPGYFLSEARPYPSELVAQLGEMLGQVDRTLSHFDHEACHRFWHWDLRHLPDLRCRLHYIRDARLRNQVDYFLLQFETHVLPHIPELRKSVIHNDINEDNVLVNQQNGKPHVCGLIDFGDLVYTCTMFEVAIALAYLMMDQDDPISVAELFIQAYHKQLPLTETEIGLLFYAVTGRLCQSLIVSAFQTSLRPKEEHLRISVQPGLTLLEKLLATNPIEIENRLRRACGFPLKPGTGVDPHQLVKRRHKHISPVLSISYQKPLHILQGAMQYLFDDSGRSYLDCINNVCHVGHSHPYVVRTIQKQAATLNTNTRYLHRNIIELAERLVAAMPDPLKVCFFVNSGSEANELALRLARTHTGRKDCIVVEGAYHGHTSSLIEISPYKFDGPGGSGAPSYVHKVPVPDLYRGKYRRNDPEAGQKYATEVASLIDRLCAENRPPAFFISESLLSCGGQIPLPDGYLPAVYRAVREAGGVCIADEVQVGFGRVGTKFWGFQLQNVVPDIVTLGKPMGNGHPLSAVITTWEIAESFDTGMEYFNTFGGNPVSCAAGLAVLDVVEQECLQENALQVGTYLLHELQKLQTHHPLIGDVRGSGLFIGVELVKDRQTLEPAAAESKKIIEAMKDRGVLLSIDGPLYNVIKIKPPMVFTRENADFLVENLDGVLSDMEKEMRLK